MKKKSFLKTVIALVVITQPFFKVYAQAPNISYSGPVVYNIGATITPVVPANSGGVVPATIYGQVISDSARNNFGLDQSTISRMFGDKQVDLAGNKFGELNNAVIVITNNQPGPPIGWNYQYWVGDGNVGFIDGVGTAAEFGNITDGAFDKNGNLILADFGNGVIRKVTPTIGVAFTYQVQNGNGPIITYNFPQGLVTTLPGTFSQPYTVAVDGLNNIYVYDRGVYNVYKISADGNISLLAGSGTKVLHDGVGASASFSAVNEIGTDDYGNVYVNDIPDAPFINFFLRKIITTGYSISPTLPAGLIFDAKTGTISGSPTIVSPATDYTVTAYNSFGSSSATINIKTNPGAALSNLAITKSALNPVFASATSDYTAVVPNTITSVRITPTAIDGNAAIKVAGVVVASGSASQAIALAVGPNVITTVVTAPDGTTTKTYTVTVTRISTNAVLSQLKLTPSTSLTVVTGADYKDYTTTVPNTESSVQITPTAQDATASINVNGFTVPNGTASAAIPLNVGDNVINTVITAQDGITTKTYSIKFTRQPSANASLAGLTLSSGTLAPVFAAGTTNYTASVSNAITSVTVTPTTSDVTATVKINNVAVASGTASGAIPLAPGPNSITTIVSAQDGTTTKTYTLIITRVALTNALLTSLKVTPSTSLTVVSGADYRDYTTTVPNTETNVQITPTAQDATATITVNGVTVASGAASASIPLNVGDNVINTIVTAQDGTTTKTYSIKFTRLASANAGLASLTLSSGTLSPVFATGKISYTAAVSNAIASVTVTPAELDATATITVNGATVVSGAASASLPLDVGPNTLTTVVTAQNGTTTKTYTVTVTRAASTNAVLSQIKINPSTSLTVVSGTDYKDYTTTVPNTETSVKITPTAQDATATIKVNGVTVASGTASASIPLNLGDNVINTVATAQDGITSKTYSIKFTRQPPAGLVMKEEILEQPMVTDALTVHQNVSPNGDGKSDILVIDGITAYPENKVQIMNRSGALVYEAKGYDNQTQVFDGHSSNNGKLQQAGTYMYSLEYKDGNETKHKTGFIVLKY